MVNESSLLLISQIQSMNTSCWVDPQRYKMCLKQTHLYLSSLRVDEM